MLFQRLHYKQESLCFQGAYNLKDQHTYTRNQLWFMAESSTCHKADAGQREENSRRGRVEDSKKSSVEGAAFEWESWQVDKVRKTPLQRDEQTQ